MSRLKATKSRPSRICTFYIDGIHMDSDRPGHGIAAEDAMKYSLP